MRALLACVVLAACAPAAPPPVTLGDASRAHVELAQLQEGRSLLVRKCGQSCHVTPMPSQHAPSEWPGKLDEMSARAGLDHKQRALIEQYLVVMASR